jgi:hypothetical protein
MKEEKKKSKQPYKKDYEICPMIEAACCISAKGKGYDINKEFNSWIRDYIKEKLGINNDN